MSLWLRSVPITMSPTDTSVAQLMTCYVPIDDDISVLEAIDDAPLKIIVDVIVHQEDEVDGSPSRLFLLEQSPHISIKFVNLR